MISVPEPKNFVVLPTVMDLLKSILKRQDVELKQIQHINSKAEQLNGTGHSE
jgi:hypothetical protein